MCLDLPDGASFQRSLKGIKLDIPYRLHSLVLGRCCSPFLVVNNVEGSLNHKGAIVKVAVVTSSVAVVMVASLGHRNL